MPNKKIVIQSFAYAGGALLYIALVAMLMRTMESVLGQREDGPLAPVGFLLLLVTSAATMGMLIFGHPVMLYIDGKKKDAVKMVIATISILAVCTVLLFAALLLL